MKHRSPVKRSELYEKIEARGVAEREEASRDTVRDLAVTALVCVGWALAGIALIALSAHTSSLFYGRLAFYSGVGLGNAGVIFTVLGAYRRGEKRGDW